MIGQSCIQTCALILRQAQYDGNEKNLILRQAQDDGNEKNLILSLSKGEGDSA